MNEFWKDKTVLVTGGTGFVGKHLVPNLEKVCKKVFTPGHLRCEFTNYGATRQYFGEHRPDVVIHMAALCGGIGANKADPLLFYEQNSIMGWNILRISHEYRVQKLITLGTVCAYPKHCPVPFKEHDLWNGYPEETNAPYGLAKRMLLVHQQAMHAQDGFKSVYLLPANLFGPCDNFHPKTSHVIPAMIRKFFDAKDSKSPSVEFWGTGKVSREFLYVDDLVSAILHLGAVVDAPDPINVGNGREVFIKDLAEAIRDLIVYDGEIVWNASMPDGQPRRCLDTIRAKERGWTASTELKTGLLKTIKWFREAKDTPEWKRKWNVNY